MAGNGQVYGVANVPNDINSVRLPLRCPAGSRALATIQLVSGSILFVLDFIGYGFTTQHADYMTLIGANIWTGAFFIVTGVIGLRAVRQPTENIPRKSLLTASLVLNIIGSVLAALVFSAGIPVLMTGMFGLAGSYEVYITLRIMTFILTMLLLIVSIINSAFGCCNVCRNDPQLVQVVYVPPGSGVATGPAGMDTMIPLKMDLQVAGDGDGVPSSHLLRSMFDRPPKYEAMNSGI